MSERPTQRVGAQAKQSTVSIAILFEFSGEIRKATAVLTCWLLSSTMTLGALVLVRASYMRVSETKGR
jgi:hypothetical protein